jgi:HD-GYP domain-containing protein (c-di-GMP phosphodiesterase class II)
MQKSGLKLSELIGSLSHALDITEGQPEGHCVRCCWIGMHIGRELGCSEEELWELYYTLLLKDLGCSSNAARISQLYLSDDLSFKRDFKWVDNSKMQALKFVVSHTGLQSGLADRFKTLMSIFKNGGDIAQELIQTRCHRGAEIARQLRFGEGVAAGIHALDEHWDGNGRPDALAGEAIPLYARIALLSQVVDVFHTVGGPHEAMQEIRNREGRWFDPRLVEALERVSQIPAYWPMLKSADLHQAVLDLEPGRFEVPLDDDYLDEIAAAFGQIVDAKSPYTQGHSVRVALYTDLVAAELGVPLARRRWLKRGALLHDVGKLGVSNTILDKPGKLDADEWEAVKRHASYSESIMSRIGIFQELAAVSGAHHERLDGGGYPKGLKAGQITLETRIITVADIFDAITAERPYRGAIPVAETLEIMSQNVGSAIDPDCFRALQKVAKNISGNDCTRTGFAIKASGR